jgi:hypothetical protein
VDSTEETRLAEKLITRGCLKERKRNEKLILYWI